ncbi:glucose-6-phosphate isomerase [Gilvimarinus sp. F26214L]|uniref:glucose-6-phosphate isomerase n=1 Tax=Gilvimarinus sp. DZF01 TaxID=3461371 RepID=UPI0040461828
MEGLSMTYPGSPASLVDRYSHWSDLQGEQAILLAQTLNHLFAQDPDRAQNFTLSACGLTLDYSKNHLNTRTLDLLLRTAREAALPAAIEAMFSGERINTTEDRSALHVALRSPNAESEEERAVHQTLTKVTRFVDKVHRGKWLGFTGHAITDVVNIGIGGSDLGPRMVTEALQPYHQPNIEVHFVSNVDGADLSGTLAQLKPETTLFIVASKSFSTLETLENARSARQWVLDGGCSDHEIRCHFVAITSKVDKAVAFGIDEENLFPMWDWVGGRYSLWSAIGLPIALAIGAERFKELLAGAHSMDEHFRSAELLRNMPVIQALTAFWYNQFWDAHSQVVLPYNALLRLFPGFLQQLDMESLGKGVDREGRPVGYPTGLVIWGSEGTNGQHSFHQLLHQGTRLIPADFIVARRASHPLKHHQEHLVASCLSQSQALMAGKSYEQARAELIAAGSPEPEAARLAHHKAIPGNRPSNTLFMEELNPQTLGALIALYEHKVFVLSVLLNINAFDQWGVELGKQLSAPIYEALTDPNHRESFDSSTQQLIDLFRGR